MAIDLNQEQEQKPMNLGPVPAGSVVMLSINVQKPQYASPDHEFVSEAKTGLRTLWCKFEVISGEYEGVSWHENLALPAGSQKIRLTDGQNQACIISGRKIRAIVEAARNISPKDESERARRGRDLRDWLDLNGMEFPARLAIDKEPYIGRDGQERWSNVLGMVITPDRKEYAELKQGQEIITTGPVTGQGGKKTRQGRSASAPDDYDDLGPAFPSDDPWDNSQPF